MILTNTFNKINQLSNNIRVIQGSSSAGKTYSIIQKLILQSFYNNKKKIISIVTDSYPNLKRGAFQDFKEICDNNDINAEIGKQPNDVEINNYTYQFISVDDAHKARGGRRDILFINEANRLDWEIARQLIMRTRDTVYIDYNPDRLFWVNDKYINTNKCDYLIVTYKDNEQAPKFAIEEIESYREIDPEWYKIFGLGILGDLKGSLYSNLKTFNGVIEGTGITATDPKDTGGDYWCTIHGVLKEGLIYINEVVYTNANPEVTIPRTNNLINSNRSQHNYLEINYGGSFILSEANKNSKYEILPIKNQTNKLTRIINEARFIKKYFRFRTDGSKEYNQFLNDVKYFTGEKKQHDDAPDALTMLAKILQTLFYHEFY